MKSLEKLMKDGAFLRARRFLTGMMALLGMVSAAFASFEVPNDVYPTAQLKKAQADAKAKKKAVTFLYTDPGST